MAFMHARKLAELEFENCHDQRTSSVMTRSEIMWERYQKFLLLWMGYAFMLSMVWALHSIRITIVPDDFEGGAPLACHHRKQYAIRMSRMLSCQQSFMNERLQEIMTSW